MHNSKLLSNIKKKQCIKIGINGMMRTINEYVYLHYLLCSLFKYHPNLRNVTVFYTHSMNPIRHQLSLLIDTSNGPIFL